jgi:hypothetical protein
LPRPSAPVSCPACVATPASHDAVTGSNPSTTPAGGVALPAPPADRSSIDIDHHDCAQCARTSCGGPRSPRVRSSNYVLAALSVSQSAASVATALRRWMVRSDRTYPFSAKILWSSEARVSGLRRRAAVTSWSRSFRGAVPLTADRLVAPTPGGDGDGDVLGTDRWRTEARHIIHVERGANSQRIARCLGSGSGQSLWVPKTASVQLRGCERPSPEQPQLRPGRLAQLTGGDHCGGGQTGPPCC